MCAEKGDGGVPVVHLVEDSPPSAADRRTAVRQPRNDADANSSSPSPSGCAREVCRACSPDLYPPPDRRLRVDQRDLQLVQEARGFPLPGFGSPGRHEKVAVDAVQESSCGFQHRSLPLSAWPQGTTATAMTMLMTSATVNFPPCQPVSSGVGPEVPSVQPTIVRSVLSRGNGTRGLVSIPTSLAAASDLTAESARRAASPASMRAIIASSVRFFLAMFPGFFQRYCRCCSWRATQSSVMRNVDAAGWQRHFAHHLA